MSNGPMTSDPPIIVQGGNSVDVDVPGRFREHGPGGSGGRKFRNADQDLISVTIDGKKYDVNADSLIEIRYGTRGGGKSAS